jgi:hypothetical protein
MKTFTKTYTDMDFNGNEIEITAEYCKVNDLLKTAKDSDYELVYRGAVDWCQSVTYVIDGIVWKEETFWKNCNLVGCGEARKIGKASDYETDSVLRNYFKHSIRK